MGSYLPSRRTPSSTLPHEFLVFGEGAGCVRRSEADRLRHDRTVGSHKIMKNDGWADCPFSFHDSEELGPTILAKISKKTDLQAKDL